MTPLGPVVLAFQRFGPYHRARLREARRFSDVVGLELGTRDDYGWAYEKPVADDGIVTAFPGEHPDETAPGRFGATLRPLLRGMRPSVIAIPGWGQRSALNLLAVARALRIPTVLMSDSTALDSPRRPLVERFKGVLVKNFDAALVAGTRQRDYLLGLGFPEDRIALGLDVVDNAHFSSMQSRRGSGPPHFLCVARFIPRKNLARVIEAYALYRETHRVDAWDLRIIGEGPERAALDEVCRRHQLTAQVRIEAFAQYDHLPHRYGEASAFILASTSEPWGLVVNEAMAAGLPVLVSDRCGCATDLVREGENGFLFDPDEIRQLTQAMGQVAHGPRPPVELGRASARIIADWDLRRFAEGLQKAQALAMSHSGTRQGIASRAALWASRLR